MMVRSRPRLIKPWPADHPTPSTRWSNRAPKLPTNFFRLEAPGYQNPNRGGAAGSNAVEASEASRGVASDESAHDNEGLSL